MNETQSSTGFVATLVAALLPIFIYIASYFALVKAEPLSHMSGFGPWQRVAQYRAGGGFAESAFTPLNWID